MCNSLRSLPLLTSHRYLATFPLLCLAAQYSEKVYDNPSGQEKDTHVGADWKTGTKAMVVKSVPMDDMNTIVFAIRGSQTFMDWVANFNSTPTSPEGFLVRIFLLRCLSRR
jgi:outer membrane protease